VGGMCRNVRMKTTCDAAVEEPYRPPLSTGLSAILGEASLSSYEGGAANDDKFTSTGQSKAGWTETEDKLVLLAVRTFGTQWTAVSDQLVGRTADAVRNRWHRLQKRGLTEASEEVAAPQQLVGMAANRAPSSEPLPPPPSVATPSSSTVTSPSASSRASCSIATLISDACDSSGSAVEPQPPHSLTQGLQLQQLQLQQRGASGGSLTLTSLPNGGDVVCLTGSDHGRARWTAHEDQVIQRGVARWGCRWRQIAAMLPGRSDSSIRNRWMRLLKASTSADEGEAGGEADEVGGGEAGGGAGGDMLKVQQPGVRAEGTAHSDEARDGAHEKHERARNGLKPGEQEVRDEALILLGFASQPSSVPAKLAASGAASGCVAW